MTASATADWALSYAAVGWRCFPLIPGEKVPWFKGWPDEATTEPRLLKRWFANDSNNIGVIAGEAFDAFDVEAAHLPAFAAWMRAGDRSLPLTPIADTGRGGKHILVAPTGMGGTKLYLNGTHIGELKSTGGFIVACPSVTEDQYSWRYAPAEMAVAEAPDWLLSLVATRPERSDRPVRQVRSTREALASLERLAGVVAKTKRNDRNNILYWAAMRALEEGIPQAAVAKALTRAAEAAGLVADDGLRSVQRTLRSAFEAQP